jgi:hypothetical protein
LKKKERPEAARIGAPMAAAAVLVKFTASASSGHTRDLSLCLPWWRTLPGDKGVNHE